MSTLHHFSLGKTINFKELNMMMKLFRILQVLGLLILSIPAQTEQVTAVTVDTQGKISTATAVFSQGLSVDGKNFTATINTSVAKSGLYFQATITLDDADVGKTVDILLVVGRDTTAPYDGNDAIYTSVDSKNKATPVNLYATPDVWMAQLTTPYKTGITLQKTMTVKLGHRKLPIVGAYFAYVAYRTPDGAITYTTQPAVITITN
jgi:hypothetical protein